MKSLLLTVIALPLLGFAETKFATVDVLKLIRNHPNYESNRELVATTDKDYQKKLEAIKEEGEKLQEEGRKLAEQLRAPVLSDKAKAELENQLMALQQKLVGVDQRYRSEMMRCRQDLQDLESRLLKATTDNLRKRIKAYAESKKYDMVLDKTTIPYSVDSMDITDCILIEMGIDLNQVKDNEGK